MNIKSIKKKSRISSRDDILNKSEIKLLDKKNDKNMKLTPIDKENSKFVHSPKIWSKNRI